MRGGSFKSERLNFMEGIKDKVIYRHVGVGSRSFASRLRVTSYLR
jgi:hypothetical protein